MIKSQAESRIKANQDDLADMVVGMLAADQIDRCEHSSVRLSHRVATQSMIAGLPAARSAVLHRERKVTDSGQESNAVFDPIHRTLDHVSIQVQRLYYRRRRVGFWLRVTVSALLLCVLGVVCYYLFASATAV